LLHFIELHTIQIKYGQAWLAFLEENTLCIQQFIPVFVLAGWAHSRQKLILFNHYFRAVLVTGWYDIHIFIAYCGASEVVLHRP